MAAETKNLLKYLILPLCLLLAAVSIAVIQSRPDFKLHVNFYDSGQVFIRTYQGNKVLVDGGPDDKILSELGKILPFYDHQIDLLILTKADDFHATGLVYVLKRSGVKQVLLPDGEMDFSAAEEFLDLIEEKHIAKNYLSANQQIYLDSGTLLDLAAKQVNFGKTQIKLSGYQLGEVVSDGANLYKF